MNIQNFDFWHVIILGRADIVRVLLAAGANPEVYEDIIWRYGPLVMSICTTGRNDIAEMLINAGANVNRLTPQKYSALHYAAWHGNIGVVRLLLDHGARDDDPTGGGHTPLALAAHGGHDDVLELFIRRGCSVNNSDKSVQ